MEFAKSNELAIISEEPPIEATMSIHGLDMSNLCINYVYSGNPSAFKMIYSKMTREEFIKILKRGKYSHEIEGDVLVVTEGDEYRGDVSLADLTTLPPGVVFKNKGYVRLDALTTLPPGVVFENGGSVFLNALTTLPPDVVFENDGHVYLSNLTSLSPGVVFKNEGSVFLNALTTLPPGVVFKNGGGVWLYALIGGWFIEWEGNIEGIDHKRLLNGMIKGGLFER